MQRPALVSYPGGAILMASSFLFVQGWRVCAAAMRLCVAALGCSQLNADFLRRCSGM
jgi:hypothetical protein